MDMILGSAEKQAYLQERFPQLSPESFANSRDTSFEQHILHHTQGKGEFCFLFLSNKIVCGSRRLYTF